MKNVQLKELLLVSHKEKRAKRIRFGQKITVITGRNETGKSSILKSIYSSFGADSAIINPKWKEAVVSSCLTFSYDAKMFTILRSGGLMAVYNENKVLLGKFTSITNELAPFLAKLFQFDLVLQNRNGEDITPTPAFMFLPYYIDQDHGWNSTWSSFARLQQFSNWRTDVVYYHTGIRPSKYYRLKVELGEMQRSIETPKRNLAALKEFETTIKTKLYNTEFELDINDYKDKIEYLINECERLRNVEDHFRNSLQELETEKLNLLAQSEIVEKIEKELSLDYRFATEEVDSEAIDCPTCGQTYDNSFQERFELARDEHRCSEFRSEILERVSRLEHQIEIIRAQFNETKIESQSVSEVLNKAHGEVTLQAIIQSEGRTMFRRELLNQRTNLENKIGEITSIIEDLKHEIETLKDKKREKEIKEAYFSEVTKNLLELDVRQISEDKMKNIVCKISETGSVLPRAILAYFFAILKISSSYGSLPSFPIVIDSPKQQDMDDGNYMKIMRFIKTIANDFSQVIIGCVDDGSVDFGGQTILLQEKNYALDKEEYEKCAADYAVFEKQLLAG